MNYDGRDLCLWGSRDRQTKLLTLQGNALWRTGTFKPTKDSLRFSLGNTQERAALAAGRNLAAAEKATPAIPEKQGIRTTERGVYSVIRPGDSKALRDCSRLGPCRNFGNLRLGVVV